MEAEKAGRRELENTLEALQSRARDAEGLAKDTARDGEEIMKALYGQVEASNKVRRAVPASRWYCFVFFVVGGTVYQVCVYSARLCVYVAQQTCLHGMVVVY